MPELIRLNRPANWPVKLRFSSRHTTWKLAGAICILSLLTGCGKKGPLTLPEAQKAEASQQAQPNTLQSDTTQSSSSQETP
ncbi:MAG: lipoprotein [Thiomicrorhabdus chilensis]|uniref:LPS translocon maturation chaperone LptM n=1 Tax=Thiomicrorhabdus chilensis TaxID=63656 RepID=UPI00299D3A2A|nr:lipoprotein [Thiomicrorhabdus chilensis]MDX1347775.1 lipoprotein [Thiomicrorhabdus chilensis]